MDLHKRYVQLPTVGISVLELLETSFKNDPHLALHRLVKMYNQEIVKESLNMGKLEVFRTILCYEYQLTFHTGRAFSANDVEHLCVEGVENVFFPLEQPRDSSQVPVLYDIVLLQMVLYGNSDTMRKYILKFQTSVQPLIAGSNEARALYIKIIECFLESLKLQRFLYQSIKEEDLKKLSLIFLGDVKLWLTLKEGIEWKRLASILPEIINIFGHEDAALPIWNFILNELDDYGDSFAALCILSDIYFPAESKNTKDLHELWVSDKFWSLILNGIQSRSQHYRKQAIFIMKKAVHAMTQINRKNFTLRQDTLVPFMCDQSCETSLTINDIKDKFFLVLEALEEKQLHLIIPALSHIPNLLKANNEHTLCGVCFSATWVRCLFRRILCHENNNVVKWGLIQACKLDIEIYNGEFLELFISVLNNTFLYECRNNEHQPEIVTALVELFTKNNDNSWHLLSTFFVKINQVAWGPVAMFYVTMAMEAAVTKAPMKKWCIPELEAMKALVSTNLTMHSHILRMASQIQILNMIPNCFAQVKLPSLANTLVAFPREEAFRRKSPSWNIISSWLSQTVPISDAVHFIKHTCQQYHRQSEYCEISTESFALMIFLLFDSELVFRSKECPAKSELENWLYTLNGVDMRPYADLRSNIKVIKFMYDLQNFALSGRCDTVNRLLSMYSHNVLTFLQKNVRKVATTLCYEEVKEYLVLVTSFLDNKNAFIPHNEMHNYVHKFYKESVHILENIGHSYNMEYLCGLHILYYSQNIFLTHFRSENHEMYTVPLKNVGTIRNETRDGKENLKGRIVSECQLMLAKLTYQYLANNSPSTWYLDVDWLQNLLHLFESGGIEIVSVIAKTLQILITGKKAGYSIPLEDLKFAFDVCWRYTFPLRKNKLYWTAIKDLVGTIVNSNLLAFPNSLNIIKEFIDQLLVEADNLPQLRKILLNNLESLPLCTLKEFQVDLLTCMLHGYVPRRDKKIENQACLYIAKYFKDYYSEHMSFIEEYNVDATVRAQATVLLHRLLTDDSEYASTFLPLVFEKLEKDKNKRYFNHSQLHRLKNRIMQVLLVLEPVLSEACTVKLQETICNLILVESNQHSVRLMQEWLLTRIFVRNVHLHNKLWDFFEESIITRPGCTISAASIVYHVAKLLPLEIKHVFLKKGIPYIVRCCLGQQFNMRLYSQVIFIKLYESLSVLNYHDIMLEYKGLYDGVVDSVQQGNLTKKSINIQDDFYFSAFHPINDYSLQTIYFELPRLCDMEFDEWIAADIFTSLKFEKITSHPLKLLNSTELLTNYTICINLTKSPREGTNFVNQDVDTDIDGLSNIQKKMIPSELGVSFNDEILTPLSRSKSQTSETPRQEDKGLIVVASLIDRPPNLGGLARTCEIFGVTEFVIANLSNVKDKEFQSLSVSAEKWINISEVKKHELQKYLLEKKDLGWTLFGAEQTANSTSLMQTKFSEKSILVLGNEKDGIPPNLIPLFDTCIEIPQFGIIRSLNVHVTGAICIWQYVNQCAFIEQCL